MLSMNFNKIFLIIKREFITRVRTKQFIISTLLTPLLFMLAMGAMVFFATQSAPKVTVLVHDGTGLFAGNLKDKNGISFQDATPQNPETLKLLVQKTDATGLLIIPQNFVVNAPENIQFYSKESLGAGTINYIERSLTQQTEAIKLKNAGLRRSLIDSLRNTPIDIKTYQQTDQGLKKSNTGAALAAGMGMGILMYLFIILYGMQVLRGVAEEKTNRIVEIIASSVKPFELMMGKILGIAAVGLVQFLLWIALSAAASTAVGAIFGEKLMASQQKMMQSTTQIDSTQMAQYSQTTMPASGGMGALKMLDAVASLDIPFILSLFLFYFFGGYLLYSALFAAVGSAVDSEGDTQQLIAPIMVPIILAYMAAMLSIENPHSSISVWFSIIPFTSPIVMMTRLPFGVPTWQLITSMSVLVVSFVLCTWFAARIYRVGILMYGKKITFKELLKWASYKA
jgi:ABC-2 type transport system permease protein